jgi:hypothetical protein
MSIITDIREALQARRDLARATREAQQQVATVAEALASRAARDLADDDAGWRRLSDLGGAYDYTAADLADIRTRCISLWKIDPTVAQAVSLLQSGALRDGELEPDATDERVQEVVDEFWQDDDNQLALFGRDGLALLHLTLMLEGERFLTLFTSERDAAVRIGDVRPDEITQVITHPENWRRPVLYKREYRASEYNAREGRYHPGERRVEYLRDWRLSPEVAGDRWDDDAPLQELLASVGDALRDDCWCYHARVRGLGLRGMPAVWRAFEWAKAHGKSLSTMMTLASALAAFAWTKTVKTKSAATLEGFAATHGGSPAQGPGAMHVGNDKVDLQPVAISTGGTDVQEATARQMHLQQIRTFGFGEHWYSDATRGNLATAAAMELPAIWRIENQQALFRQILTDIIGFAVAAEMLRGNRLPADVDTAVGVNFPDAQPATPGDVALLLNALTVAVQAKLIEPREAALQAYQALGTVEVQAVMERQFPEETKLDGEQAQAVGGEPQAPPGDDYTAGAVEEAARLLEAVGGSGPFGSAPHLRSL